MIIQNQTELKAFCAALAEKPYITVDTEFLRDKTYYSILCLIQIAAPGIDAKAIDPIAFPDLNYAPLWDLMANDKVLKVMHAARQDMEIFYAEMDGALPRPIFDTQVAAMVCGHGDSIAYNALVKNITGTQLAKNAQFTDWSRRPLTPKQLAYALDDVTYLRDVYEKLAQEIEKQGRTKWVRQEMDILTSPDTYKMDPKESWKRIKIRSHDPKVLASLQMLAAWREEEAQRKDIPRGRILKDDTLAELALYSPKDADGLMRIRTFPKDWAKGHTGKKVLELIAQAQKMPKDQMPQKPMRDAMPRDAQDILEMLKLLLKINCNQADVATKLVANASDLEILAVEVKPDILCMKGWRFEVFGKDALALKNGKLALGLKKGKIEKIPL